MMKFIRQLMSREPEPETTTPVEPAAAHWNNPIADMILMGQTAVATLTVTELTQDEGAEMLAGLLDDLRQCGANHFVLDIQNVQHMDSTCLGCLVEALNAMAAHGGKIALANSHQSVEYVFRLTRLDRVFPICKDVVAAIDAVEGRQRGSAA